jgi:hypothetical protein
MTGKFVMTPDGIGEVDFYTVDGWVYVWLGNKTRDGRMRKHRGYKIEEVTDISNSS